MWFWRNLVIYWAMMAWFGFMVLQPCIALFFAYQIIRDNLCKRRLEENRFLISILNFGSYYSFVVCLLCILMFMDDISFLIKMVRDFIDEKDFSMLIFVLPFVVAIIPLVLKLPISEERRKIIFIRVYGVVLILGLSLIPIFFKNMS